MEQVFIDLGDKIQIKIKHLKINTILACHTYDANNNIVKEAYSPFTKEDIDGIINSGIEEIYYSKKDASAYQPLYEKNLKDYLNKNVYKGPRTIALETQKTAIKAVDNIISKAKENTNIDFNLSQSAVNSILSDIGQSNHEIINLISIQSFDDFIYTHSINTAIIAMIFAKERGLSNDLIKSIGLGGFLHDIGDIRIPYETLHKKGELTENEYETIKKHTRYSYEIVKNSSEISELTKKIVLLHHEKYDGSGYPFGFKDEQIDDAIYIVALADFYDALTTERPYKKSISTLETIKLLLRKSGESFKPELTHSFVKGIGNNFFKEGNYYTIGNYVILNTKEIARVVSKESETSSRPVIEIVRNEHGKNLPKPISIDLNKDNTRYIDKIINYENS